MTYTTNYSLHKPSIEDNFNLNDLNTNSDLIDSQLVGSSADIPSVTCSTAAGTLVKEVSIPGVVHLRKGLRFLMTLSNTNTKAGVVNLQVNSLGSKPIFVNGVQITGSNPGTLAAGTYLVEYDGTQFKLTTSTYTTDNARIAGNVTGTVNVGHGGTGNTTLTTNAILLGNGTSAIKNGAVIGTGTTTYLRNDGQWGTPAGTTYDTITQAEITAGTSTSSRLVTPKLLGDNFVKKESGKGLSTNDFTTTLKDKLDGIEDGAQVNTLTGVKGDSETTYRTGNVNITKANIGLGNVDNTADADKAVKSAGKWTTARNISISDSDGTNTGTAVSVDGSAAKTLKLPSTIKATLSGTATNAKSANNTIAYCSTAAGTAAKTASLSNFVLESGQRILLYIANANSVASATLNVNSTGAKAIKINGTTNVTASNLPKGYYMAYYTVVSDVGYWYLYPILNLNTGTSFNGTSTGITTDANFGALGVKAWYFSSTSSYIVFTNGLIVQWGSYTHDNTQKDVTQSFIINYSSSTSYALIITNKLSTSSNAPCDYAYTSSFASKTASNFTRKMTTNNRLAGFDWLSIGY